MSPKSIILIALLALCVGWYALDARLGVEIPEERASDRPLAPDATFSVLNSSDTLQLKALRGRWVLLNIWASWCAPCKAEFPDLVALAETYPEALTVLAVTTDRKAEDAQAFLQDLNIPERANFIIAHDPERRVTETQFFTYKYPESILIDPQGRMQLKVAGILSEEDVRRITARVSAQE
tara:strand:+ start:153 stop:692 length:540 start_codon:yes stop_codon:yes gene_type:complete